MFRMLGDKVELIRYEISYISESIIFSEDGEEIIEEYETIEKCISEEHRDEVEQYLADRDIDFTTKEIDQSENEWIDGLLFGSYDEALEVLNLGESEYIKSQQQRDLLDPLRLRADIDYMNMSMEVNNELV